MASSFLGTLSAEDHLSVMRHPVQRHNVGVVEWLVTLLRRCRTFEDYDNVQRALFQHLHHCEEHRSQCRRSATRLARNRSLPTPLPTLPDGADPLDPRTWQIEDMVFDRVCRQLRAVGDALAWRVSRYDRRYVIALSSNDSCGPMAGKTGLPHELGAVIELRSQGSFGLLHDLTNCLRIGDITEFKPDGSRLLYEIKSSPNSKSGPQRRRMRAAIEAVMHGGELPGRPGNHIVVPTTRCRTHIRTFASGIAAAVDDGISGTAISSSRALTAFSFETLGRTHMHATAAELLADFHAARQAAIRQAGIQSTLLHVKVSSVTRNHDFVPSVMPFALYPLHPHETALLICDYLGFEVTVAPERITAHLERLGFTTDIPLPAANDDLVATDTVITLRRGSGGLRLHPGALYEFLMESLDLSTWAGAITEVMDDPKAPPHPLLAFATTRVWR
jgi:hypothetical protein